MRSIGFKNFRKFKELPSIALSPITILVGENNAGKSTVVKGILALNDFLTASMDAQTFARLSREDEARAAKDLVQRGIRFYFNSRYHAHLGTFRRALCNEAAESVIEFRADVSWGPEMTISVKSPEDALGAEAPYGVVRCIRVKWGEDLSLDLNLEDDMATIEFLPKDLPDYVSEADALFARVAYASAKFHARLERALVVSAPISPNLAMALRVRRTEDIVSALIRSVELSVDAAINPTFNDAAQWLQTQEKDGAYVFLETLPHNLLWAFSRPVPAEGIDEETKILLKEYMESVSHTVNPNVSSDLAPRFALPWYNPADVGTIEYIYAHEVAQTAIYLARNANDYLSQTIHEYASKMGQRKHPLVLEWMQRFGIGKDFNIQAIGGEAYLFTVTNLDGTGVDLSAKGMGSIQLMVLLLRLALFLPTEESKKSPAQPVANTFIMEEPEQNLHPMLQSKLADLFYELHSAYGFRFIVETHSEYLVRRSQVIVGEQYKTQEELDAKNPFKVYYFPSEDIPYDMKYTLGGMFEKKFGDGFMNEAGKLHMAVLKNLKENR